MSDNPMFAKNIFSRSDILLPILILQEIEYHNLLSKEFSNDKKRYIFKAIKRMISTEKIF